MNETINGSVETVKALDANKFRAAVGKEIQRLRETLRASDGGKLSQGALGKLAGGLRGATVSAWERGRSAPDLLSLVAISRALRVDPDYLLLFGLRAVGVDLKSDNITALAAARRESVLQALFPTSLTDDEEAMVRNDSFRAVWSQVMSLYKQHRRDSQFKGWEQLITFLGWEFPDSQAPGVQQAVAQKPKRVRQKKRERL